MARAMVFGYVPTREFLLERVRDKNLMQYDVEDEYTVVAALQAGLKDLIAEARLRKVATIQIIKYKERPQYAIVLRNNWDQRRATDEQIDRMGTLVRERLVQVPRWLPLYVNTP